MTTPGQSFNPYQAPVATASPYESALPPEANTYWRQGDQLVAMKGAILPAQVCLATGKAADGVAVTKKLQWAHPAVAIAILFNALIYVILYLALRKRGSLTYGLSSEFRSRRIKGILLAVLGPVVCILLMGVGAQTQGFEWALIIGVIALFATLIGGIMLAQPFRVMKIDEHHIYLKLKPEVFSALGL
ncbi:hypothetical protein G6O69_14570 [Pseudenhygromyxa sp. WMMC2535]|uniref:hypothetical protein n=1 Tax=Pseudenhygromyxa sp. WMMC2535 TaxID=2712867 RepID=UPI001555EAF6|nr:hypothetical protein [Pseudenhygromyxa sp. WMMC2535]NVB39064.1 hypothetical protein [Pseudenhygromyxa sp. WMMC2535]